MHKALIILAAASSLCLTGCFGGKVVSNVSQFSALDTVSPEATYTVMPWREELGNSLEFRNYATQLSDIMRERGLRVVPPGRPAQYIAYLDYGIDNGRPVTYTYNVPEWGKIYNSQTTSTTVTNTANGQQVDTKVSPSDPTYGVTGYRQEVVNSTNYSRFVNIDIVPAKGGADAMPVLELRLKSSGWCGSIPALMPRFMQAIDKRFAKKSASAGKVTTGDISC